MTKQRNREGNGTPLQYSCLENATDGGAWKAAVHGVAEGRTRLSDFAFTFHFHALEKEMAKEKNRHLKLMNSALSSISEDTRVRLTAIMPSKRTFTV